MGSLKNSIENGKEFRSDIKLLLNSTIAKIWVCKIENGRDHDRQPDQRRLIGLSFEKANGKVYDQGNDKRPHIHSTFLDAAAFIRHHNIQKVTAQISPYIARAIAFA